MSFDEQEEYPHMKQIDSWFGMFAWLRIRQRRNGGTKRKGEHSSLWLCC
jgi:hypothetical protein